MSPLHFAWVLMLYTMPTTIWVNSSADLKRKLGKPEAVTATAHKLARIVFHLLTTKEEYDESVFIKHEKEAAARAETRLRKQAAKLGFQRIPAVNG